MMKGLQIAVVDLVPMWSWLQSLVEMVCTPFASIFWTERWFCGLSSVSFGVMCRYWEVQRSTREAGEEVWCGCKHSRRRTTHWAWDYRRCCQSTSGLVYIYVVSWTGIKILIIYLSSKFFSFFTFFEMLLNSVFLWLWLFRQHPMQCLAQRWHRWNQKTGLILTEWNAWWTIVAMLSISRGAWFLITSNYCFFFVCCICKMNHHHLMQNCSFHNLDCYCFCAV